MATVLYSFLPSFRPSFRPSFLKDDTKPGKLHQTRDEVTTTKELSCSEKPFHTKATLPSGRRSSWLPAADHGATRGSGARHTWRVTVISPPPERICSVQTVWMCRAKGLIWPAPVVGFIRRLRGNKGGRRALGAWWGVCRHAPPFVPRCLRGVHSMCLCQGGLGGERLILPFPYAPVHLLTKCLGHQPVGAFLECGCVRWQREGRVRRGGGRFAPGSERRREEEWRGGVLLLSTEFLRDFGLELSDNTRVNSVSKTCQPLVSSGWPPSKHVLPPWSRGLSDIVTLANLADPSGGFPHLVVAFAS